MLVLDVKVNQAVEIDGGIVVSVLRNKNGKMKLGFSAPRCMQIRRCGQYEYPAYQHIKVEAE